MGGVSVEVFVWVVFVWRYWWCLCGGVGVFCVSVELCVVLVWVVFV